MTTITNFLQGNFTEQETLQEKQTPIWVLLSDFQQSPISQISQYTIQQFTAYNRPLLHIDLGMKTLKQVKQAIKINQFNVPLYKIRDNYYVMRLESQHRQNQNMLNEVIKTVGCLSASEFMKKQKVENKLSDKMKNSMGLIVQGLQLIATLPNFTTRIQQFIGALSNLPKTYKQITILVSQPELLKKQYKFVLERISTCLTILEKNKQNNIWHCTSTVRRYTGFSNEEKYLIKYENLNKNNKIKIKVEKIQKEKHEEESTAQKDMIAALGFGVKKNKQEIMKEDEKLKRKIYPHLQRQEQLKKNDKKPVCQNCQGDLCHGCDPDEDLIILDDEQEDDDDIDV